MMRNGLTTLLITGMSFFFLAIFSSEAFSQAPPPVPEQAIKEVDRGVPEEVKREMLESSTETPLLEEAKPEGPVFFVKKIKIEGLKSLTEKDLQSLVEKYENREVALPELKNLADEIEKEYLKKGIIAVCVVPPQDIKGGIVMLRVAESSKDKKT